MPSLPKFTDNAYSTLDGAHSAGASTIDVVSASLFPSITAGEYYYLTIWDSSTYPNPGDDSNAEIHKITGVSSNTLTLDSTLANAHSDGAMVALLITSDLITDLNTVLTSMKRYYTRTVRWNGSLTSGSSYTTDPLPKAMTLVQVKFAEEVIAQGSSDYINVFKNGALTTDSVFLADAPMEMPYTQSAESNGVYVVEGSLDSNMTSCVENDKFTIMCTGIGSTSAGSGVDVQLLFEVD